MLVRPYGCPLNVRTRDRLNICSCLVFLLQCSKAGGAVEKSPVGQLGAVGEELGATGGAAANLYFPRFGRVRGQKPVLPCVSVEKEGKGLLHLLTDLRKGWKLIDFSE